MAKLLKLRRGTTTQHASFTGAEGELTIDITKDTAVVHDGSTQAGKALLREDLSNLPAGQIDNNDVNASAAIAGTKIAPDFGSQNITTTGNIGCQALTTQGNMTINNTYPCLNLTDTDNNSDYQIRNNNGHFAIQDTTNSAQRFTIGPGGGAKFNGNLEVAGNLDAGNGLDVTGNLTTTGTATVDGNTTVKGTFKIDNVAPIFHVYESDNNKNYYFVGDSNNLTLRMDGTSGADTITRWNSDGHVDFVNNVDFLSGIDVTGAINATTDIKTTTGKFRIDSNIYVGEVSSAPSGAESPDGSTEIVNGAIGKDLSLRAYGDIVLGSSNNTYNTVAQFVMPVLGASKHGKCVLKYVTANAGGSASSATKLETSSTGVSVTGALVASGNVTAFSDAKLKTDIHTINDALGIVGKLRGVYYKWLSNGESDIGVIAQEVEAVVPEVVKETQDGIKTVDYGRLVGVLINAVNELKAEVEELKNAKITE